MEERGQKQKVRTLSHLHKNGWNLVYRGNYAEISHKDKKVQGHGLEKNPGREVLCDLKKIEDLLEIVSLDLLVIMFSFAYPFI